MSSAASCTAQPVAKVVRLPPVVPVQPIESVSTMAGFTSSYGMPSDSAWVIAIEARWPPMSTEPITRLTVPSALTLAYAADSLPPLNQKPIATPRPRFSP